jgi:NurA-like 5'-3' nuclease
VTTDSALLQQQAQQRQQLLAKSLCTISPSAEVFEGDQIYLLDDRTSLYMYVGRNIPRQVIDELMETTPGVGGLGKRESVSLRTDTSELARRMQAFINLLRSTNAHKQGNIAPAAQLSVVSLVLAC